MNFHTSQIVLIKHKQQCGEQDITSLRLRNESHLFWKKLFHKNPLFFRIYSDFEADNEIDNTYKGNKTTNFYKQNPILNGYYIISELDDVLKNGYQESPLSYNNLDWFVDRIKKLENKVVSSFKNTKRDHIMIEENEEEYRRNNVCRFCDKENISD